METAVPVLTSPSCHVSPPPQPPLPPPPPSRKEQRMSPDQMASKPNNVGSTLLYGVPIVSLVIENQERLCLAQISNTLLKEFSYNEIHNRRVALGITCVQCTPVQLEILRRAGAMPVSSRRCGMITRREADRLCKSFLGDNSPPRLPEDFAFSVHHECAWGCRGAFLPSRYNSSRAKCIKCQFCGLFFSPNKFIFHSHRSGPAAKYVQPDAANFNSWRRHMKLSGSPPEEVTHAWEDVKAMFNGGTRKRLLASSHSRPAPTPAPTPPKMSKLQESSPPPPPSMLPFPLPSPAPLPAPRVPPFTDLSRSLVMDYVWHHKQFPGFAPYAALPWLGKRSPLLGFSAQPEPVSLHTSAFRPVFPALRPEAREDASDEEAVVDVETTEEDVPAAASVETPPPDCSHQEVAEETDQGIVPDVKPNTEALAPPPKCESPQQRLWTMARLDHSLYRQEVARQIQLMRESHSALHHLSHKMVHDCSACNQLYSSAPLPPDDKLTH